MDIKVFISFSIWYPKALIPSRALYVIPVIIFPRLSRYQAFPQHLCVKIYYIEVLKIYVYQTN